MKLLVTILMLFGFYCVAEAAVSLGMPDKRTDCSSGTCIDYCNYEDGKMLPGEIRNENCSIKRCHEDFSFSGET